MKANSWPQNIRANHNTIELYHPRRGFIPGDRQEGSDSKTQRFVATDRLTEMGPSPRR